MSQLRQALTYDLIVFYDMITSAPLERDNALLEVYM